MRHLIDPMDLSVVEINNLLELAKDIHANKEKYQEVCKHKTLATCFFEPSTRTRLSFEAAMLELGGHVIGFSSADSSSATKGESVGDTAKTIACYADIIAMRHPMEGAPYAASQGLQIPLINAGDGGHNHPTQTLTDLLTILEEKGHLDQLVIGLCGDLKYGRTVHSLIKAMSRYSNIHFVFISPSELKVPEYIIEDVVKKSLATFEEVHTIEEVIGRLDVLYMTRVQRERFTSEEDYQRLKDTYILDCGKLNHAKQDLIIMHPLPRVNEIATEVDDDPRAAYFRQVNYGRYVRMALIITMLGIKGELEYRSHHGHHDDVLLSEMRCKNPRCITVVEMHLQPRSYVSGNDELSMRCSYCDAMID